MNELTAVGDGGPCSGPPRTPGDDLRRRLRSVRLVVFDIDGTVRSPGDAGCRLVEPGLDELDAAGIPWTFATGRPLCGLLATVGDLNRRRGGAHRPVICNDGGILYAATPATPAIVRPMSPVAVERALRLAAEAGVGALVYAVERRGRRLRDVVTCVDGIHPARDGNGVPVKRTTLDEALRSEVVSLVLDAPIAPDPRQAARLREMLAEEANVTCASIVGRGRDEYIVSGKGVSKGAAVEELAAMYGIGTAQVMAVGDGPNDVGLFRAVGVGYAVANAFPELLAVADRVCTRSAGDGAAEAVAEMLRARRGAG